MVAAIDKSNELVLTKQDFNTAIGWLIEAEQTMPYIFQAGAGGGVVGQIGARPTAQRVCGRQSGLGPDDQRAVRHHPRGARGQGVRPRGTGD